MEAPWTTARDPALSLAVETVAPAPLVVAVLDDSEEAAALEEPAAEAVVEGEA